MSTPGSNLLKSTHAFLCAYIGSQRPPQLVQRLSVAIYELFDNAMNYGRISSEIVLELLENSDNLAVRVSNESSPARINMLSAHLARVQSNAEATFVDEMKRSVTGGSPRAMLGLARIAFEAKLELKLEVEGLLVLVSASARL